MRVLHLEPHATDEASVCALCAPRISTSYHYYRKDALKETRKKNRCAWPSICLESYCLDAPILCNVRLAECIDQGAMLDNKSSIWKWGQCAQWYVGMNKSRATKLFVCPCHCPLLIIHLSDWPLAYLLRAILLIYSIPDWSHQMDCGRYYVPGDIGQREYTPAHSVDSLSIQLDISS